jgi:formylglycine-generating enzyme required for sulfatase activity
VRLAGEQWLQSQVQLTVAESAVSDPDATQMEDGSGSSAGTSTQAMLGTFEYMSPEQREGVEVDARSDLYSVGLIAFRMLTGQKVLGFDLPSKLVPGLDSGWDSWMRRSLAPALKDRFPDARAMLESLPGVGKTVCCTESRKRNLLWIAVIIVISALVGLGVFIGGDFDRESEEKASNALRINGNLGSASTADESKEPTQKQPAPQEDRVRPNNSVAVSENVFESTVAKEPMTPTAPRATLSKKVLAKAGEDYTFDLEAGVELEMVWVDRLNGWVGRYEITNSQYRVFRSDHRVSEHKGLSLGGSRQPVVNVNYGEVLSYLDWLNKRLHAELPEKYHFRLPDGDEWTHFSKCGDDRKYPWGNQWPPSFGNYAGELIAESLEGKQFHSHEVSAPVPESGKNLLGLYGVGGNVWEWTSESSLGGRQALRGGSWYVSEKEFLECEFRNMVSRSKRDFRVGFRVVLMP